MKRWFVLGLVLIALVGCSQPRPLTLVIIPGEEASLSQEQFAPLVKYLSTELGREVKLLTAADYAAVVEAMKYKHADIARFGPFDYVLATQQADVEAIAAGVRKESGKPEVKCLIIARADRAISSLNGASFAYVDVGSTTGYLIPTAHFEQAGIELGEVFFAGTHSAVIEAVKNGTVDAGATADNRYSVALEEGVIKEGELTILWSSEPIPMSPIAVQKSMDTRLKVRLTEALLACPQEVIEPAGTGEIGFAKMEDSDYDVIREIQEALGLGPE